MTFSSEHRLEPTTKPSSLITSHSATRSWFTSWRSTSHQDTSNTCTTSVCRHPTHKWNYYYFTEAMSITRFLKIFSSKARHWVSIAPHKGRNPSIIMRQRNKERSLACPYKPRPEDPRYCDWPTWMDLYRPAMPTMRPAAMQHMVIKIDANNAYLTKEMWKE